MSDDDNPGSFTRFMRFAWDANWGRIRGGRGYSCSQNVQCSVGNRFNVRCYQGKCINKRQDPEKFTRALELEAEQEAKASVEREQKRKGRRTGTFKWPKWDTTKKQGQPGFVDYVTSWLKAAGFEDEDGMTIACDASMPIQAYQEIPSVLMHPNSTMERLMLIARTGSGKTRTMINIMNNHFYDPRVKLVIVPNTEVKNNMLKNMVTTDSLYRDFVIQEMRAMLNLSDPRHVVEMAGWKKLMMKNLDCVAKILMKYKVKMKAKKGETLDISKSNFRGCTIRCWTKVKREHYSYEKKRSKKKSTKLLLVAPIRILTYGEAGGSKVMNMQEGYINYVPPYENFFDEKGESQERPAKSSSNAMSNKIIFMDEAHNLIRPPDTGREAAKIQKENLKRLRKSIQRAQNSVVVFATATPIVKDPADGDKLLNVLRGTKYGPMSTDAKPNVEYPTNEGFVSYFQDTPASIYPQVIPGGSVEGALPEIHYVDMAGDIARNYMEKKDKKINKLKMRNYTALGFYFPWRDSNRKKMLDDPYSWDPKYAEIADTVVNNAKNNPHKTLIMCHRKSGIRYLNAMIEHKRKEAGVQECFKTLYFPGKDGVLETEKNPICKQRAERSKYSSSESKRSKASSNDDCGDDGEGSGRRGTKQERFKNALEAEFNSVDNKVGEQVMVITADSQDYSEGVSFDSPTLLILADVPLEYSDYLQQAGRLMRMCKYHNNPKLTPQERQVTIQMYVSRFPSDMKGAPRTVDEELLDNLRREFVTYRRNVEEKFKSAAVDAPTLDPFIAKIQASHEAKYGGAAEFDDDATPILGDDGFFRRVRMDPIMKQPITYVEHPTAQLINAASEQKVRKRKATSGTKRKSKSKKGCNPKNPKHNDPAYECGPYGRYRKKK